MNYQPSEIKRIARKARRFHARNKHLVTKFKIDTRQHPGESLYPSGESPLTKSINNENL